MDKTFREIQKERRLPLSYGIYKGVRGKFGAMRLKLKKAYTDEYKGKFNGIVFLEAAPTVGPDQYDWENQKITIGLGISDIGKILLYLRSPNHSLFQDDKQKGQCHIFHDKNAGTAQAKKHKTNLWISKPADKYNFFFSITEQTPDGGQKKATLPVSPDEAIVMGTLLQESIPEILAW